MGRAGKLLDQLLGEAGLVRDDVFITNVVKVRPPGNRDPRSAEVEHYLARSFDYIVDLLSRFDRAEPYRLDPSGDHPLRLAKRVRRHALRTGGPDQVRERADHFFSMPRTRLAFAESLAEPINVRTEPSGAISRTAA